MGQLDGRVAIVTGAGAGIGRATAALFAAEGARVVMTDRARDGLVAAAAAIGGAAFAVEQDVAEERGWSALVAEVDRRYGRLDILINNAGYGAEVKIVDMMLADWRAMMAVNCDGVFLGMKHAIPAMAAGGAIVNVSSIYGKVGGIGVGAYTASKGAVALMTKTAALECADLGIRVNSLHPGFVETQRFLSKPAERQQQRRDAAPMGRAATPEEIARAALFLSTEASSFMTGAELVVDGGYTAR